MQEIDQDQTPNTNITPPDNQVTEPTITYNLDNITKDCRSARIISQAYATNHGELNAILTYFYQGLQFDYQGRQDIKDQLNQIAMQEMEHFELLGQTLIRLRADPIFTAIPPIRANYYNTRNICYLSNQRAMLNCAIQGETRAIREYKLMLNTLTNQEVKNVINHILAQEEQHLIILNQILAGLG